MATSVLLAEKYLLCESWTLHIIILWVYCKCEPCIHIVDVFIIHTNLALHTLVQPMPYTTSSGTCIWCLLSREQCAVCNDDLVHVVSVLVPVVILVNLSDVFVFSCDFTFVIAYIVLTRWVCSHSFSTPDCCHRLVRWVLRTWVSLCFLQDRTKMWATYYCVKLCLSIWKLFLVPWCPIVGNFVNVPKCFELINFGVMFINPRKYPPTKISQLLIIVLLVMNLIKLCFFL